MILSVLKKISDYTSSWRIHLVLIIIVLFLVRLALPQYVKYLLFPILTIAGIISFVIFFKNLNLECIKAFDFSLFMPIGLISLLYIIALAFTLEKQNMLVRDFINVLSVWVFILIVFSLIDSKNEMTTLLSRFVKCIFIVSVIISLFGLIKLYLQLLGIEFAFLKVQGLGYPSGSSLAIDNNFFSLLCVFGIILSLPLFFARMSFAKSILSQFSLIILWTNIYLSTSRRGFIFSFLFLVVTSIILIISFIIRNEKIRQFRKNTIGFVIISISSLFVTIYLLIIVPPIERNKKILYSKYNQTEVHSFVNYLTLSIKSIFKGETKYNDINREIWESNFDPRYPYSGWASGNYSPVSMFKGDDAEIVPEGAIGAMIDSKTGSLTWNENAYYYSLLFEKKIEERRRYLASVYCYVSPEFNGSWVRISSHGDVIGAKESYYDMKLKGKWQKLITSFFADSGMFITNLYFSKYNSTSFDSLKGNIIFAYPELKEIDFDPKKPVTWAGAQFSEVNKLPGSFKDKIPEGTVGFKFKDVAFYERDSLIYAYSNIFVLRKNKKQERSIITIYVYVSDDFNGDRIYLAASGKYTGIDNCNYDLTKKGEWGKLLISVNSESNSLKINFGVRKVLHKNHDSLKGHVVFAYPELEIMDFDPKDPITWATRNFKPLKKISGKSSEIVPANAIGCVIENTSNFTKNHYSGNFSHYINFNKIQIEKSKQYISSVYCYVSNDFNGDQVRLRSRGIHYGPKSASYDMNLKGIWQKLVLKNYGDSSYIEPFLFFEIPGENDVKWLKGYVVYAYPQFIVSDESTNNSVSSDIIGKALNYDVKSLPATEKSGIIPLNVAGYAFDKSQLFTIKQNLDKNKHAKQDSLTSIPEFSSVLDNNLFTGPRLDRWRYAFYLFKNEYNNLQRLFGGGFGYTRKFAKMFNSKGNDYDYPHNPVLSVLLYSGVFGLIIYLWFLIKAFYLYWIYRKEYWTIGLCFLIGLFYAFFSSNNPFEPAIIGILTIIPYFIHYHHLNTIRKTTAHNKDIR